MTATTEDDIDHVHHMLIGDRVITLHQVTNAIRISNEIVENILHIKLHITEVSSRLSQRLSDT